MDFRKRGRAETTANGGDAVGSKRSKEGDSISSGVGIGSKSKPCTKFFSTAGCPYGEGCHFMHYVPGGVNVVAQMTNLHGHHSVPTGPKNPLTSAGHASGPVHVKTKICNKYNTSEGCKFGDKCHFAHGEKELGRPTFPVHDLTLGAPGGPPPDPAASFGASATAKISVDASLTGAIIGKGGVHSKQITRVTGAKLSIRDHESEKKLKNIELEGTFDQINHASAMVRELILTVSATANLPPPASKMFSGKAQGGAPRGNYKTKMCDNFAKGSCTFGDRCHFAHGEGELRQTAG